MKIMKALSVRQPWASLIVNGIKNIENRTWQTSYRGPILIQAGQRFDPNIDAILPGLRKHDFHMNKSELPRGGIIGMVDIVDIVTRSKSELVQKQLRTLGRVFSEKSAKSKMGASSEWFEGPYGWVLANARTCEFIPYKGKLGLFEVQVDINWTG